MTREQLTAFILERYSADQDSPWLKYPEHVVFRHPSSRKWFALLMRIPKNKLGLDGDGMIDVLNVKCDPLLIGSLREEQGIFPAYHMSKTSWITLALEGGPSDDKIVWLLDLSYDLTNPKKKRT